MLKSPRIINSWGVVAAKERKELKSSRKTGWFRMSGRRWRSIDIED